MVTGCSMNRLGAFASALLISVPAFGQEESGAYVGIGLGQLDHEERDPFKFQDESVFWQIHGGYRFGENWALEGAYGQSNDLDSSWSDRAFGPLRVDFSADYEFLQIRGLKHFGKLFIGLGLWKSEEESVLINTPSRFGPITQSTSDSGSSIAVGGQWDFTRTSIRTEYEHFDTRDIVDVSKLGVSVQFRF